jgi:cytochrome c biogenesis protein CcmG/thiol:disulfide interchange protein DsbE
VTRWIALAPLAVLAALAILFATFGLHHDPHFIPDALVGHKAPQETLPLLNTMTPTSLNAQLEGVTLVNFFASWCPPCAEEAPALLALQAQGVRIVGVAYKDDPAKTKQFLSRLGDPFTVVFVDRQGRAAVDFGVDAAPDTFLVDQRGVILAKHAGPLTVEDAQTLVDIADRAARSGDDSGSKQP